LREAIGLGKTSVVALSAATLSDKFEAILEGFHRIGTALLLSLQTYISSTFLTECIRISVPGGDQGVKSASRTLMAYSFDDKIPEKLTLTKDLTRLQYPSVFVPSLSGMGTWSSGLRRDRAYLRKLLMENCVRLNWIADNRDLAGKIIGKI